MSRNVLSLRFTLIAVVVFFLAGAAATAAHRLFLLHRPPALVAPWIDALSGLVISFMVALPTMLVLRRTGGGDVPQRLTGQKSGAEKKTDAIL